ncbi:hypothetical protein RRG08_036552 [Elysia crispata]|uniref:Uncharacterized protein n=1 Tax=Elysia crispata TaxID=231223 RepID=A0AAE1CPJ7_9GAST|nr:hypothetical protein RRG08_036552 [Elysia crispata]
MLDVLCYCAFSLMEIISLQTHTIMKTVSPISLSNILGVLWFCAFSVMEIISRQPPTIMKTVSLTSLSNMLNVLCLCAFSLMETITASHDHENCIPYKLILHAGRLMFLCILLGGNS